MGLVAWLTRHHPPRASHEEAEAALQRAHEEMERIEARWPEVQSLREMLRILREKNHFIEGFKKTL